MNELRLSTWTLPAAAMPRENPLAPMSGLQTASAAGYRKVLEEDYPDKGNEAAILPYLLQDEYDRRRSPRAMKTAVLENDHLRATFMLDLGGRLWSLFDKRRNRELLHVNPVFQPANLAARDAWFSGGVEWNISIIAHCPFTCSPLFAARVRKDDGTPVLRLYEWERIRRVPFQIDFWLRDDAPLLMARMKIINPHDYTIPMYWWSNIAVDETPDLRVLGPATSAQRHDYDGNLVKHDIPIYKGIDVSYPARRPATADLYFGIPKGHRPWVAALDGEGMGLVQTSTERLIGRKMFNWGQGSGGKHWQEFLAEPGHAYIEIQGGLAGTQSEYVAMPAGATWDWLEAYGLMEADPSAVHSSDWQTAINASEKKLEEMVSNAWMKEELSRTSTMADRAPEALLHNASGWGALERLRREAASERPFAHAALPFPDATITSEQAPWLALLQQGALPESDPADAPGALMVQPEWREILERSAKEGRSAHWLGWYHLGVMRYRAGDKSAAREAFEASLKAKPNAWAQRNLAVMARREKDLQRAADLFLKACELLPNLTPLAIECCRALLAADRVEELLKFVESRPPEVKAHGRIRLLHAEASLRRGRDEDLQAVAAFFDSHSEPANIREKEISLSDLWFGLYEKRQEKKLGRPLDEEERKELRRANPPPRRFDFRLTAGEG